MMWNAVRLASNFFGFGCQLLPGGEMWPQPPAVALTNPLIPLRMVGAATLLRQPACPLPKT